jgi:5-hydroxyisourate hydrolase
MEMTARGSPITTHVLDLNLGRPAGGLAVVLERAAGDAWRPYSTCATDADGRVRDLIPPDVPLELGLYRLRFDTAGYFRRLSQQTFYPEVVVVFEVDDPGGHYHVPLLLAPFGYSTYRGS